MFKTSSSCSYRTAMKPTNNKNELLQNQTIRTDSTHKRSQKSGKQAPYGHPKSGQRQKEKKYEPQILKN